MRRTILLVASVICLGVGGYLIYEHRASIPPDPETAPPEQMIAFIHSPYFTKLPAEEQKEYLEAMLERYASLSKADRQMVDEKLAQIHRESPEQARDAARDAMVNLFVYEAQQYVQIPPEKRDKYLRAKIATWEAMFKNGPRPRGRDGTELTEAERQERRRKHEEERDGPITPEMQTKMISFFQTQVWPHTSAKDRAYMMAMMKDLAPIARERDAARNPQSNVPSYNEGASSKLPPRR